jgi:hypothetical protein
MLEKTYPTTCKLLQVLEHCTCCLTIDNFAKRCITLHVVITSVYNILYMGSFKCLSVQTGLNGCGKKVIILSVYRCICSFVGHLLRKTPLSVHAHERTRDLADFCQILYCGGVSELSGAFQHRLKSVKNDSTLRSTHLCAHLEHKFLYSCQSQECHKSHREKMIYECCTQYILYVSVMVFVATFPSLYIQYGSATY